MSRTARLTRLAAAALALTTATALASCSKDSDDAGGSTSAPAGSSQAQQPDGQPQDVPVSDTAPSTPIDQMLLAQDQAPGNGQVVPITHEQAQAQVDRLVQDQGQQSMEDPACDRINRLETVANHGASDGASELVRYKQADNDDTLHQFVIGMVYQDLKDFNDRGLFEQCHTSKNTGDGQTTLNVAVADAPAVAGARGFRVTSDFIRTDDQGTQMTRVVSLHGYAHGTSVGVEYMAAGNDPAQDPVLPTANQTLEALYTAQMDKLVKAQ